MTSLNTSAVDVIDLTRQVREMYTAVALQPEGDYHFELGRDLAERLGYAPELLDQVPAPAVDSFAGVGNPFQLADLTAGERVLDLGSGSGMDVFAAAVQVGPHGHVVGRDFTPSQLEKAERLRVEAGFGQVELSEGPIEHLPFADDSFDVVISNGVVNLSAEKTAVFAEAARVLRPGGRLVVADIVSGKTLPERVVCNADLWAACIGGAAQQDDYQDMITAAGFTLLAGRRNDYHFISDRALGATDSWDVKSVTLLGVRD
jgi:SAM-dependent methyltransferase